MDKETNEIIKEIFEMYESMALNQEAKQIIKDIKEMYFEKEDYKSRIDKAIKYINTFEDIKAYFSYVECGYEEYNYNDNFKKELLSILRGEE